MSATPTIEELESVRKTGAQFASKPVLSTLMDNISELGAAGKIDAAAAEELVKEIRETMTCNSSAYFTCEFDPRDSPYPLHVCLAMVKRDYVAQIDIPAGGYEKDLFMKYNMLKVIAAAYWCEWREQNLSLHSRICKLLGEDNQLGELTIDPANPTTIYLMPQAASRVGIFCYYMNTDSSLPMYRK